MKELTGKYNSAKVFTDNIDGETESQIENLLDQEFISDSKIRIMPDTHAGKGCVVGFTMEIKDKVVPNLVGVDIGCGMDGTEFLAKDLNLEKLDRFIHEKIPHGFNIHQNPLKELKHIKFDPRDLRCFEKIKTDRILNSIGSLGGGNHFIEINKSISEDGVEYYLLVIHSGSRNLGVQVANYYQNLATHLMYLDHGYIRKNVIEKARNAGLDIQKELDKYSFNVPPKDLCYLEGDDLKDYLHDMKICQEYATINRCSMAGLIIAEMNEWDIMDTWETIHNYINFDDMILRKGAVSAREGEKLIIPINMRDGSLICVGKGNPDWNYSAPHGAGRIMSRNQAKEKISLEEFEKSMEGVFSTSVNKNTLDESPMSYKPLQEILNNIGDTVEVIEHAKPIYNFKAG